MVKAPLPPPPPRPVIPQKVGLDTCESVRLATGHYEDDDCENSCIHSYWQKVKEGECVGGDVSCILYYSSKSILRI